MANWNSNKTGEDILANIRRAMESEMRKNPMFGSSGLFSQMYGGRASGAFRSGTEGEAREFSSRRVRPLWADEIELPYHPSAKLMRAVCNLENESRQLFDCRLGPGGVYHPEEVRR